MPDPITDDPASAGQAWLPGTSEIARLISGKDWGATPLGPITAWPQSLKTTLGLMLHSRYPMFVFWGPELVKIYNDAYRPITGDKHPWALGRPAREVWPEIWEDIAPLIARALSGEATWSDDLMLFMERQGFPEEVYFTFSYSPVPDESGGIGGMFCACTETTAQVIGERRLRTLREMTTAAATARTVQDAVQRSVATLGANPADVSFALCYLGDADGGFALSCHAGLPAGLPASPALVAAGVPWPVAEVAATGTARVVDGLGGLFGDVQVGPWPEHPASAMVLPLADRAGSPAAGALVVGLSARRPFDVDYRRWCEIVAAQMSASMAAARAAEDERDRVESAVEFARERHQTQLRQASLARDLRNRVDELETLLNVLPVGVGLALDRDCRDIQMNAALSDMLGLPRGANASLTAPGGERPRNFRVLDVEGREIPDDDLPMQVAAREGREIRDLEVDVVRDDGRVLRLLQYASPLFDERDRPRGCVSVFVDLSERRKTEARNQFLMRFDDAVRALTDPHAIMALASELLGEHLGVSRCGYADVDPDGEHFTVPHEYVEGDDQPSLVGRWACADLGPTAAARLRRGETLVVRDYTLELPGEAERLEAANVRATIFAVAMRDGKPYAFMGVHSAAPRDWTDEHVRLVELAADRCWDSIERARAMRAVAQSEARLRSLFHLMPQLVWTAQADGSVAYFSARAAEYHGIGSGAPRVSWQPMVHPDDLPGTIAAWERAARAGTAYSYEHRLLMADGSYRWHLSRAEPILDDGRATEWIGTATDVHELRETQEALRRQDERLREMDRRKDEFIAILAHELRNPLAPLRSGLEVLRLAGDDPGMASRVRPLMERQVTHMVRLIDDLLDVSRITSGKIQLQQELALVETLVRDAVDSHRAALQAAQLTLDLALPAEPCYVYADPARFVQVLSNLLHNAIKFTEPGGRIRLTGSVGGATGSRRLRLVVEDTGSGISREALPHIFELFTQGDHPASRGRIGLGIGLALARRLVEMHGGTLEAESEGVGRGARFIVSLPILELERLEPSEPVRPVPQGGLAGRVLIVDDNGDAAEAIGIALERLGASVRTASNGEDGIALAAEFEPDAILLDIGMPGGLDGYQTCARIRERPSGRRVAIIALTGFGQDHDKARAAAAGFDAHVTKPADLDEIYRLLRRHMPKG